MSLKAEKTSNSTFGIFFTFAFILLSGYFFLESKKEMIFICLSIALVFMVTTIFKPSALEKINEIWFHFGVLLGKITGPIVLGVIFFGIILPISMVGRLFNRDELKLKKT